MTTTHFRSCNLCEAMCGIAIEVDAGGVIHTIRGDRDDPFSRGYLCPKAMALKDLHEDPDRIRQPMRRTPQGHVPVSWDEAFAEIARRTRQIRRAHGRDAIAIYYGNPSAHNYATMVGGLALLATLRTRNRYSASSADQLPRMLSSLLLFGHQLLMTVPDIDRTSFLLVLGGNPAVSNGSLMSAPGVAKRLEALRARGGRLVVVDPRRSETAELADTHLFIRPGTDALLLFAMLEVIFSERLANPGRLTPLLEGLERVRALAARFSPERVAPKVGIDAAAIRALARDFATAPSAACYGRIGTNTQRFGGLCAWLIDVLNAVTGNLDRVGGVLFTRPAADLVTAASFLGQKGSFATYRSRARGLPEFGGELPVSVLAEEIETPDERQVRALFTVAGNPVLSAPNGTRIDAALRRLELVVSVDFYLNETTRHAHFILPPTGPLERDHYDLALNLFAVRNTAKYSPALFAPPAGAKQDWEILLELAHRIGGGGVPAASVRFLVRRLGPHGLLDVLLRTGPHGDRYLPFRRGLSRRRLEEQPHGVDLGPLEPCLPGRLATPDRLIRLAPAALVADVPRLERFADELAARSEDTLWLIGRRDLRSNNSWMHNSPRLVKGRARCTLLMHPQDAGARGLADGDRVQITSRVGSVEAPLVVTEEMMPGVVSLPHGWGHAREGVQLRVAADHAGVSVNDLTDEDHLDELSGNAGFSGVPVSVVPVTPAARAV